MAFSSLVAPVIETVFLHIFESLNAYFYFILKIEINSTHRPFSMCWRGNNIKFPKIKVFKKKILYIKQQAYLKVYRKKKKRKKEEFCF